MLLAAAAALAASPCRADLYGLAIGIDDYRVEAKLQGAVKDAEDIARALGRLGAREVVLLRDAEVTRERVRRSWHRLAATAQRGDTIVFSFAGHGSQEPEAVAGSEEDGLDETFLLAGFDRTGSDRLEHRIVDNEVSAWLEAAGARGIRVVFVADTCHSGTLLRSADPRVRRAERSVPPYGRPVGFAASHEALSGARLEAGDLPNVTYLGATEDHRKVQAVPIDGELRGALSYAFARALEQASESSGTLTRFDLESFVRPMVRQLSESRQVAQILPRSGIRDEPLIEARRGTTSRPSVRIGKPLRLKVLAASREDADRLLGRLEGVVAAGEAEADLVFDAGEAVALSGLGDVIAHDVNAAVLQGVIDKWHVVAWLKRKSLEKPQRPLPLVMHPGDQRHGTGTRIIFESAPLQQPYVTALNLAPDGSVKLLYPAPGAGQNLGHPARSPVGAAYRLPEFEVTPPYGADHLVVLASERPLLELHGKLARTRAAELPALFSEVLEGIEYQIGIQGLYTFDGRRR